MASLSISSLLSFFSGEQKSIDRGENHFKSNHVESFIYSGGVIKGEVKASMKNRIYKVTVSRSFESVHVHSKVTQNTTVISDAI